VRFNSRQRLRARIFGAENIDDLLTDHLLEQRDDLNTDYYENIIVRRSASMAAYLQPYRLPELNLQPAGRSLLNCSNHRSRTAKDSSRAAFGGLEVAYASIAESEAPVRNNLFVSQILREE
jgi:hypothetical protein